MCHSGRPPLAYSLSRGPVFECRHCGVLIAREVSLLPGQDRRFYEGLDESRYVHYFEPFRKKQYREVLTRLAAAPGSTLLDVGASYGWMLDVGSEFGLDCYGVEPSPMCYEQPTATRIFGRTLDEHAAQTDETYTVVTLWHVMEHLPDPMGAAVAVSNLLAEGGCAVIGVPNARGRMYRLGATLATTVRYGRLLEELWYTGNPNMHRYYFTEASLRRVLESVKLTVVDAYTLDAFDWTHIWSRSTNPAGKAVLRAVGPMIQRSRITETENLVVVAEKRPENGEPS